MLQVEDVDIGLVQLGWDRTVRSNEKLENINHVPNHVIADSVTVIQDVTLTTI